MIGFYNRSVILTYIGLTSALIGMQMAYTRKLQIALVCLIVSGICDMFDGKVARITKRSVDAANFGIQIDSLCDLVCFGVFPALIGILNGVDGYLIIFPILFTLAGVIRLGYFNVMELKRIETTNEKRKYLDGLPITSTALIFPIFIIILDFFKVTDYTYYLVGLYIITGFMFITKIKFKKPNKFWTAVFVLLAIITTILIFI